MGSWWSFLLGLILIILWLVSGSYITQSSIDLGLVKDQDNNLKQAYTFQLIEATHRWNSIYEEHQYQYFSLAYSNQYNN